jgi:hypothetical protein
MAERADYRNDGMTLEVSPTGRVVTIALIIGLLVLDLGLAAPAPRTRVSGGRRVVASLVDEPPGNEAYPGSEPHGRECSPVADAGVDLSACRVPCQNPSHYQ